MCAARRRARAEVCPATLGTLRSPSAAMPPAPGVTQLGAMRLASAAGAARPRRGGADPHPALPAPPSAPTDEEARPADGATPSIAKAGGDAAPEADAAAVVPATYAAIGRHFAVLGWTAFGGPSAHVAQFMIVGRGGGAERRSGGGGAATPTMPLRLPRSSLPTACAG